MKTVIMAGGRGTRLSSLGFDVPKPLVPIEGVPILEREIICLKEQGFCDFILTVSHMADQIINYFGDGQRWGVNIDYYQESSPLGNAGALFKIRDKLTETFLLLNGDALFDIDFKRFVDFHINKKALVTIFTHPNSHPYDSGLIIANADCCVERWISKEDPRPKWYKNRVNAGLHIIDPIIFNLYNLKGLFVGDNKNPVKVDLDRQLLKPLCGSGRLFCYDSPEYVKDMGTPDRYDSVCLDFKKGIVQAKNLNNKQKAIFLDRDGTINKYVGFLKKEKDFELLPGVSEAIKIINSMGYLVIVATNQPVIARGDISVCQLETIHNKLETLLGAEGAYIDRIYYCPHHPDKGFAGERVELKIDCNCRKPKPGMLIKAAQDLNIDLSKSWMVGDGENDILAGKAAKVRTALIGNGDYGQDITINSLLDLIAFI